MPGRRGATSSRSSTASRRRCAGSGSRADSSAAATPRPTASCAREFIVHDGLPPQLRHGIFAEPRTYRAWVRFSGPGPYVTPDIDDVGLHEHQHQADGSARAEADGRGEVHAGHVRRVPADVRDAGHRANAHLQIESLKNASIFHFVNFRNPHLLDLIMQGLWIKTQSSPFEAPYFSCVPYLLGEGQAMQYSVWPKSNEGRRSRACRCGRPTTTCARPWSTALDAGRRRARLPHPAADRSAPDADREQRGAVAGAAVAPGLGGHLAHPAAEVRFAGADRVRATPLLQPVALHPRASAARQPEPGPAPDVLRAVGATGTR